MTPPDPTTLPPDPTSTSTVPATDGAAPAGRRGRLLLIPNTLDLGCEPLPPLTDVLPRQVIDTAAGLGHWVVENAKTARALLKRVDALTPLARPLQQIAITELPRPAKGGAAEPRAPRATQDKNAPRVPAGRQGGADRSTAPGAAPATHPLHGLLAPAWAGHDIGLLSEAGLPAVADPGAALVQAAHEAGIEVVPFTGPTSLLLALAASGLNGQSFAFVGYLPQDATERAARIRALETLSRQQRQTQIAIETPYRNDALLGALVQQMQATTRLSVANGLTLAQQQVRTLSVAHWRRLPGGLPTNRLPTVYCWLAD
ncbi:MAG: hypothetical protein RIQ53_3059 [Pseudomonadota bacterium]|jgi:16S rRNA (cytidine1402-2'-O)-methyltransferase